MGNLNNMHSKIKPELIFTLIIILVASCTGQDTVVDKGKLLGNDYRLFQETPVWEIAKAVWQEDTAAINKIVKENKADIDFQEVKFGQTLLMLTVRNQNYNSCMALLELGADPNKHDHYNGSSAMIAAAKMNETFSDNTKFLKLLLKYKGNPNDVEVGERRAGNTSRETPLIASIQPNKISSPLSKVQLLIESGADINYTNEFHESALSSAIIFDYYDIVLYLLHKGANYNIVISQTEGKDYYLWDELRFKLHPLESKEYKQKMEIVEFLLLKGIDYRKLPIPEYAIVEAKKTYPNTWKDYLNKY